jgi:putative PIN family toxin of toxin-antitoxin system
MAEANGPSTDARGSRSAATPEHRIPRLVLDTNVWLDLLVFEDPQCAALHEALGAGRLVAFTRSDCDQEWRRVLGYPALAIDPRRYAGLIERRLQLCLRAEDSYLPETALPRCRDPDDQKFVELARQVDACALVSRDLELLRLDRRCASSHRFRVCRPDRLEEVLKAGRATLSPR